MVNCNSFLYVFSTVRYNQERPVSMTIGINILLIQTVIRFLTASEQSTMDLKQVSFIYL